MVDDGSLLHLQMNWTVMMSKCILLIVVITMLIVDDSVGSQNVPQTSNTHAATSLSQSDADPQFTRLGQPQLWALSEQERIQVIVDYMNEVRARQGAANMERLKWSDWLATMAKTWAETCEWKYGQKPQGEKPEFSQIGQSLFSIERDLEGGEWDLQARAVSFWLGKKDIYNHTTHQCYPGKDCYEYTQLVGATTRRVGCDIHQCSKIENGDTGDKRAHYLVCNYGPTRNLTGVHPFLKGPACSKCTSGAGWCWNKTLCDSECSSLESNCSCEAICHNCATLDENKCMCHCGAGWRGVDCSERCTDKDEDCTPNPDAVEGECPPTPAGPPAKPGKVAVEESASTSYMKSHHVMMMMFVMITTITVNISNLDAAL